MPSGLYADHLRSERAVLSLTAMLFPMPVELGQSNITGGTRFPGGFPPGVAFGVWNTHSSYRSLSHGIKVDPYKPLSLFA